MKMPLSEADLRVVMRLAQQEAPAATSPALAQLLITDGLTGVYNRTYFQERIRDELAQVTHDHPIAVFVIDVDHFKAFNDRYGHHVGDLALREVAHAMQSICPDRGATCRLGGDEFVMIIPDMTRDEARWLQSELTREIARRTIMASEGYPLLRVTASVGFAVGPEDAQVAEALLHAADTAMYTTKRRSAGERLPPPQGQRPESAPLFGRDDLLQTLGGWLQQARDGFGHLVLLEGPAGIGKSRVAHALIEQAKAQGCPTIVSSMGDASPLTEIQHAAGYLAGRIGPRHMARLAARHWALQWILNGDVATANDQAERPNHLHLADALRLLITEACASEPIVWVLDDLHHSDSATRAILSQLATSLDGLRAFFIGTLRTEKPLDGNQTVSDDWWTSLGQRPGCTRITIEPLDSEGTTKLMQWVAADRLSTDLLSHFVSMTGGNPLLAVHVATDPDAATGTTGERIAVREFFRARLARLSAPSQHVLMAAAVIGSKATVALLRKVAPETPDDVDRSADTLAASGWLVREDDLVRFSHPLARETAYEETPESLRRSLHRLAAHALSQVDGVAPSVLAQHYELGGDWEHALPYHRKAGDVANAAYAFEEASRHYRTYLHLAEATGQSLPDAAQVALTAGDLLTRTGNMTQALETLQYTLQHCQTDEERGLALIRMARTHVALDQTDHFDTLNTEGIRLLNPFGPSVELVNALMFHIHTRGRQEGRAGAVEAARDVVAMATDYPDPVCQVLWIAGAGLNAHDQGNEPYALECLRLARTKIKLLPRVVTPRMARALFNVASLAEALLHPRRALPLLQRARQVAAEFGDNQAVISATLTEVRIHLAVGDVEKARALLARVEPTVRQSDARTVRYVWMASLFCVHFYRGDLSGASRDIRRLHQLSRQLDPIYGAYASGLSGELELTKGNAPQLEHLLDMALPLMESANYPVQICMTAAHARLAAGDLERAQELLEIVRRSDRIPLDRAARLEWIQSQLHLALGRPDKAMASLRTVLRSARGAYYRAQAFRDMAQILLSSPHARNRPHVLSRAAAYLREGRRLFERLGNSRGLAEVAQLEVRLEPPIPHGRLADNSAISKATG